MTLFMGPGPFLATCDKCGKHEPMPVMPMDLREFNRLLIEKIRAHKDCQPATEEAEA